MHHLLKLRLISNVFLAFTLAISMCACKEVEVEKSKMPNVILILADDMAFGDISYINGGQTSTPSLDQLIQQGIWFNQAYSASPVCAPARAALLTGMYPHQTGCITLGMQRFPEITKMDKDLKTLADVFKENNYATGLIGKWHCGEGVGYHPLDRGFEEFEGFVGYMVKDYFSYKLDIQKNIEKFDNKYLTDDLSQRAINFVRKHKDQPFFLHLAHYAPHRPLGAPQEIVDTYLEQGFPENTATIYAMIEVMDRGIGQLLSELDTLGIRENTLIIFTSDNGPDPIPGERPNQGLRGTKYTVYEGGIHVPFIMNWQGKLKPNQVDNTIQFTDVFPTLVDLCNLELSDSIKFVGGSLNGLLSGGQANQLPERRYWQWNRGVPFYSHNAAMREGKWKLVRPYLTRIIPEGPSEMRPQLYDLENDPFEKQNVAQQHQRIYEDMIVRLEEWSRMVEYDRLKNKD